MALLQTNVRARAIFLPKDERMAQHERFLRLSQRTIGGLNAALSWSAGALIKA